MQTQVWNVQTGKLCDSFDASVKNNIVASGNSNSPYRAIEPAFANYFDEVFRD